MKAAPRIELAAPLEARVVHVLADYAAIGADAGALDAALTRLPRHHSRETILAWREAARQGRLRDLTTDLMVRHYDPAYGRGRLDQASAMARVTLDGISSDDVRDAARQIAARVHALDRTDGAQDPSPASR